MIKHLLEILTDLGDDYSLSLEVKPQRSFLSLHVFFILLMKELFS